MLSLSPFGERVAEGRVREVRMKKIVLNIIRLYQKTLSPDHGWGRLLNRHAGCRFHPSCSQYAYEAVEKYGVVRGIGKGVWRILRCNPWSKGGYDPVK